MTLSPKNKVLFKKLLLAGFVASMIAGLALAIFLYYLSTQLPKNLKALNYSEYTLPTIIYDRNGNQVDELYIWRRTVVKYKDFPPHLIQALIASEDKRFFYHFGIDPIRILKAAVVDVIAGSFVQGASTITQQTARLFLLTREKKLIRKLKEVLLAIKIETQFSKEEILSIYLNKVFLGNAEGVEASSQGYFGKRASELSLSESALLVGLLPAPSRYAPTVNPDKAVTQRNNVLLRMKTEGFISDSEYSVAVKEPLRLSNTLDASQEATAHYVELARRYLLKKYGYDVLYKGGLRVHLAMDLDYQIYAHSSLRKGILNLDKRQGFRGVLGSVDMPDNEQLREDLIHDETKNNKELLGVIVKGVLVDITSKEATIDLGQYQGILRWEQVSDWRNKVEDEDKTTRIRRWSDVFKLGDVIRVKLEDLDHNDMKFKLSLHQEPLVNGAIYSMEPDTGNVLALSGGYRFDKSQFNRAIQAKRQPGSAGKPIIYAGALDSGYTLASILSDSPRFYKKIINASGYNINEIWKPQNYGGKSLGKVTLRDALVKSLNLPTIGLVENLGPSKIANILKKLGITSKLSKDLTIGLGTYSVTLAEMTRAFTVFPTGGNLSKPIYILKVEDRDGKVLESYEPEIKQVLNSETAFLTTDAMADVVRRGTARIAQSIGRPSAGKTGTTNKSIDAWYIGFIPQLLTGVYVGFDQPTPMGKYETGTKAAAPIWVNYMKNAVENLTTKQFVQPSDIVSLKIHKKTGRRALPCDNKEDIYYEYFNTDTEPVVDQDLESECDFSSDGQSTKIDEQELDMEL